MVETGKRDRDVRKASRVFAGMKISVAAIVRGVRHEGSSSLQRNARN